MAKWRGVAESNRERVAHPGSNGTSAPRRLHPPKWHGVGDSNPELRDLESRLRPAPPV